MQLDRRTFLRGAGAALALPWLEAMLPGARAAEPGPLRLVYVYVPNGVHMPDWRPAGEALDALPWILEPLAKHRQRLLPISGLALDGARAHGDGPGDHARALAAYLTGSHPRKTAGANIQVGVSADQVLAQALQRQTRFPSLELGLEPSQTGGSCDSGYSCAYSSNVAWRSPSQPLPKAIDPRAVFDRLFVTEALTPEQRARQARRRTSVLDLAADQAEALSGRLGRSDRRKLSDYLDAVREVEQRLAAPHDETPPPEIALPDGVPRDPARHAQSLFDVLTLAFQTDSTRVATFLFGNEGSNRTYRDLGVRDGHHRLSHHGGDADKQAKIRAINRFHTEQLAYFLDRLAATPEGDGTLLDRTVVVYGSGIGDGNRHDHMDLPILLAGSQAVFTGGRHLQVERHTPLANLHLALIRKLGGRARSFGDSEGELAGLQAARQF